MIVTVTRAIPQTVNVQSTSFSATPAITVAPRVTSQVGLIGIPGPAGPPGPAGTIVHVGPTPPPTPTINDLWVDTS